MLVFILVYTSLSYNIVVMMISNCIYVEELFIAWTVRIVIVPLVSCLIKPIIMFYKVDRTIIGWSKQQTCM